MIKTLFKQNNVLKKSKFKKANLPPPYKVLNRLGLMLKARNHKDYWIVKCPFHKDGQENNPSLHIHASDGHYKCHACGEKGSNILNFYMKVTSKSFKDAAKDLGIWED